MKVSSAESIVGSSKIEIRIHIQGAGGEGNGAGDGSSTASQLQNTGAIVEENGIGAIDRAGSGQSQGFAVEIH